MTDEVVEIYSDGACRGNPGPGGWGALLRANGAEKELYGGRAGAAHHRTGVGAGAPARRSARMELRPAIRALEARKRPSRVKLYTDSTYVMKGIQTWIHDWKRRGWKTADKKPGKNEDRWR